MIQKDITFKEYFGFTPDQLKWATPNQKSQNCLQRTAYIIDWMGQNFGDLLQGQIYLGDQNISLLRGFGTQFLLEGKRPDGVTIDPIKHGDYYYWVFKDVGTGSVEVKAKNGVSVDYLLVGAGGAGGAIGQGRKGGGGAGDVVASGHQNNKIINLTNGQYGIIVGVDGGYNQGGSTFIQNSSSTKLIEAIGGGRGGHFENVDGKDGGSGGGGGNASGSTGVGGNSIGIGYGNPGGAGGTNEQMGGGGGGAGSPGKSVNTSQGKYGDGGIGISFKDIWGDDFDNDDPVSGNNIFGLPFNRFAGGGAGIKNNSSANAVDGGGTTGDNKDGKPNTGGGGGGAGHSTTPRGLGGSGLCILRIEVTKNIVIQAIQQYYNENIEEVVINNTATMQDVLEVMNRINQKWQQ